MGNRIVECRRGLLAGSVLLGLLGIAGCSEEPTESNSLTSSLPSQEVDVRETTLVATGGTSFRQIIPMDGGTNLVGRTGNYTSSLVLQFYPSLFPRRDTVLVVSATLRLRAVSWYGDSLGEFSFTVHRVDRAWGQSSLTWDSIQTGLYDPTVLRGTYAAGASPDTHTVSVPLDTAMVREWLLTPTSTTTTKYGIILVPTTTTSMVRGVTSFEADSVKHLPTLDIIATNVAGTSRDTSTFNLGQDTFVANEEVAVDPSFLTVQAGVTYRSSMTFDISFIPRGSAINRAELSLESLPAAATVSRFTPDTVLSPHQLLSATDNLQYDGFELSETFGRRKAGTAATFLFSVANIVQAWVKGENYGLLLKWPRGLENTRPDRIVFHSPQASDPLLRPRLRILYSVRKDR